MAVSTSRVFIFERPQQLSIDEARKFGAVEFVFPPRAPRAPLFDAERLAGQILERLHSIGFDPTNDYIAFTGHIVPLLVMATAAVSEYGPIRALLFDAERRDYVERQLGHWTDDELTGEET
jgi:hypothetical protein